MRSRFFLLATIFVFLTAGFSPVFGQENPKAKADRLLAQIYSLSNFPKLSPVKICIDRNNHKKWGDAYYLRYPKSPKRFLGLKISKVPEIHLSAEYIRRNTDNAVIVTLAHELGHHFDSRLQFYLEPDRILDLLIMGHERVEEDQYFAEAFALYILGEDLLRKGRLDRYLASCKMGTYWLYIETNPRLYKYYMDQGELWTNYWFDGAQSKLSQIQDLMKSPRLP